MKEEYKKVLDLIDETIVVNVEDDLQVHPLAKMYRDGNNTALNILKEKVLELANEE